MENEFKGTPGPWVVNDNGYYLEIGKATNGDIAELAPSQHWYDCGDRNGVITTSNARLIASAPELLEALQDMLSGWQYIRSQHGDLYGVGWDRAQNKAISAINKALGK